MAEVINKYNAIDILKDFDTLPNNIIYWKLIRYIILVLQVKQNISIELHPPRNTTEFFTYISDKLWSKIIHGMSYILLNPVDNDYNPKQIYNLFHHIHLGGSVNLIKYWYFQLHNKKYTEKIEIKYELSYYIEETHIVYNNNNYKYYENIDKIITNALSHIARMIKINDTIDETVLYYTMLKYIIKEDIPISIFNTFTHYLNSPYIDPCIETEAKEVTKSDFDKAMKEITPSVNRDMDQYYQNVLTKRRVPKMEAADDYTG